VAFLLADEDLASRFPGRQMRPGLATARLASTIEVQTERVPGSGAAGGRGLGQRRFRPREPGLGLGYRARPSPNPRRDLLRSGRAAR
jgi:hypothetical protein